MKLPRPVSPFTDQADPPINNGNEPLLIKMLAPDPAVCCPGNAIAIFRVAKVELNLRDQIVIAAVWDQLIAQAKVGSKIRILLGQEKSTGARHFESSCLDLTAVPEQAARHLQTGVGKIKRDPRRPVHLQDLLTIDRTARPA